MDHSVTRRKRVYPIDISDVPADSPAFEGTDVPVGYLFRYWDGRFALRSFLVDFPEVCSTQALEALRKRAESDMPVDSTDGLMGGMPVFRGTRAPGGVPVQSAKARQKRRGVPEPVHNGRKRRCAEGLGNSQRIRGDCDI